MKTWIVTDSRGKRHEVTAKTMAYSISGNVTFYREESLNAFTAFSAPVAVVLKPENDSCGEEELIRPLAFLQKIWRKYA